MSRVSLWILRGVLVLLVTVLVLVIVLVLLGNYGAVLRVAACDVATCYPRLVLCKFQFGLERNVRKSILMFLFFTLCFKKVPGTPLNLKR